MPPTGRPSSPERGAGGRAFVRESERREIAEIQRARMVAAMFEAVAEQGAANVSVADVVTRSGVSRRTFYETFSSREACFLAAFDQALAHVAERVLPPWRGKGSWQERMRGALIELLALFDDEPALGRLLLVESLAGGPATIERRNRVLAKAIAAVDSGRGKAGPPDEAQRLTAEGAVGGVLSVIRTRLLAPKRTKLVKLTNPLMCMIALPYVGAAAAKRELDRPAPDGLKAARGGANSFVHDPLKGTGLRLTYRTVSVLRAISERPGASNKQIGTAAGVDDQGQISKLLARLERLGLIAKAKSARGRPNAWSLTAAGERVVRGIRPHAGTPHDGVRAGAHTGTGSQASKETAADTIGAHTQQGQQ